MCSKKIDFLSSRSHFYCVKDHHKYFQIHLLIINPFVDCRSCQSIVYCVVKKNLRQKTIQSLTSFIWDTAYWIHFCRYCIIILLISNDELRLGSYT